MKPWAPTYVQCNKNLLKNEMLHTHYTVTKIYYKFEMS